MANLFINGFFGWNNMKWFMREILKIYSDEPSFFSKKRIESGVAFITAQWGMIWWLILNVHKIELGSIVGWASVEFAICGYVINKIQQEKKDGTTDQGSQPQAQSIQPPSQQDPLLDQPPIQQDPPII